MKFLFFVLLFCSQSFAQDEGHPKYFISLKNCQSIVGQFKHNVKNEILDQGSVALSCNIGSSFVDCSEVGSEGFFSYFIEQKNSHKVVFSNRMNTIVHLDLDRRLGVLTKTFLGEEYGSSSICKGIVYSNLWESQQTNLNDGLDNLIKVLKSGVKNGK